MQELLTAEEYLAHHYKMPKTLPTLPMSDENFVLQWREGAGVEVLTLLNQRFNIPTDKFVWNNTSALKIEFAQTLGGRLPVLTTADHNDFCQMVALLNGKDEIRKYPITVNAFTMQTKAESIYRHRVILLNFAPYSNVSAEKLDLSAEEWLKRSHKLRLRHESAHYETLRIFGGMKNHALDEILADGLGQIAAFGSFSAERQRIFFGLHGDKCDGRLQFYTQKVIPDEIPQIYQAVDSVLDDIAYEVEKLLAAADSDISIFDSLACRSILSHRDQGQGSM